MSSAFLDTNVILRHLLNDHPDLSLKALSIIEAIERGAIEAWTSDLVVAELVFVLSGKKTYNLSPQEIAELLLPIISLPRLKLPRKRLYHRVFTLYTTLPIDFIDAYNAAFMEHRGERTILSFDTDFDEIEGIKRLESPEANENGNHTQ